MKIRVEGFVVYTKYPWEDKPTYGIHAHDPSEYLGEHSAVMMKETFELEVPAVFDMRPGQIAALKAQKEKAQAEFAKRVIEIDAKINELLALEA
jgi:hypothetical protein